MNKSAESLQQEIAAIKQLLSSVGAAVDAYADVAIKNVGRTSISDAGEVAEKQTALFMETSKLLRTVRGPVDMVFSNFENSAHSCALRVVLEMGVFDALPRDGSRASATALSKKLGVSKDLLVRFLRVLTPVGPLAEVGVEEYAHTPYSLAYLVPELGGIFKLMYDEYNHANAAMYAFFRKYGFKNPDSDLINPYCFAHQTDGKNMWQHIGLDPERQRNLNLAMVAQSEATKGTVGIFPFKEELSKMKTDERTVLVVDIGGGKGHVIKQIQNLLSGVQGQLVLQERKDALAETVDLAGIATMEYDFFTPQPIKGALIYYIRRCLHDWPDSECASILKQIAGAMEPGTSRLLISEIVVPESGADVEAGWMDMTMMTCAGRERTVSDWKKLLDLSGLKLDKVYHAPGTNYAVVQADLK